jgi:hypothetical protein
MGASGGVHVITADFVLKQAKRGPRCLCHGPRMVESPFHPMGENTD